MNWLSFIVSMTDALAWPAAVVIVLLSLRRPLVRLLGQLGSLKYSNLELRFDQQVTALEERAEEELGSSVEIAGELAEKERLVQLAVTAPEAAVIEAWRYLEHRIIQVAREKKLQAAPAVWTMPMVLGALLYKESYLSDAQYSILRRLRGLRNQATHSPPGQLSPDEASRIVALAIRLTASMDVGSESPAGGGSTKPVEQTRSGNR